VTYFNRFLAGLGFGVILAGLCHLLAQNIPMDLTVFAVTVLLVTFWEEVGDVLEDWWDYWDQWSDPQ
jgi:hypothetical protein